MDPAYKRHSINACALLQLQWETIQVILPLSTSPLSGACFGVGSARFPTSFPVVGFGLSLSWDALLCLTFLHFRLRTLPQHWTAHGLLLDPSWFLAPFSRQEAALSRGVVSEVSQTRKMSREAVELRAFDMDRTYFEKTWEMFSSKSRVFKNRGW